MELPYTDSSKNVRIIVRYVKILIIDKKVGRNWMDVHKDIKAFYNLKMFFMFFIHLMVAPGGSREVPGD